MHFLKTIAIITITTFLISGGASAGKEKLSDKLSKGTIVLDIEILSCNADAALLCPGLPLNSKKSFMCLMAYENNLSTECKLGFIEAEMALKNSTLAIEHSIAACEADADKYCLDIKAGEGRIVSCLRKNEGKIKKECTAALKDTGLWNIGKKG